MPISFPHIGPDGEPVSVVYYSVDESAPRLHVGRMTLRDKCRRNEWPHLRVGGRYFLSDEHLARIIEMHTVNPDIPDPSLFDPPRRPGPIGIVLPDDEAEGGVR
jgi:excisionase family DNA binding protein